MKHKTMDRLYAGTFAAHALLFGWLANQPAPMAYEIFCRLAAIIAAVFVLLAWRRGESRT